MPFYQHELYHRLQALFPDFFRKYLNVLLRVEKLSAILEKEDEENSARNWSWSFNKLCVRIVQTDWIRRWENGILQSNESCKWQRKIYQKRPSHSPQKVQCAFTTLVWETGCLMVNDILFGCTHSERQQQNTTPEFINIHPSREML